MASATGTILGGMAGSCLPLISISASIPAARSTVCCFLAMDGVGFVLNNSEKIGDLGKKAWNWITGKS